MKSIAFTTFALATTVLSTLASGLAPSAAAAADYGYVNYRNYDEGPESLAAFRARPGWNKGSGSQYGVEWLTRTTHNRPEVSSTNQPPASIERSAGKNCNLKPMAGFNQHNAFEHSC
jgi:hypothetical protein